MDIRRLNMEELMGVVNIYPWYAGARVELCRRLAAAGTLGEGELSTAAMYVHSRRVLHDLLRRGRVSDYSDAQASEFLSSLAKASEPAPEAAPEPESEARRIFVVGGDYFTSSQYREVRRAEDSIFSSFATSDRETEPEQMSEDADLCTETLAQIYAEQGYMQQAIQIYSKLSLRYPEKSIYFASLIEKLEQN